MRKIITIEHDESENIYRLYSTHMSYINILQLLGDSGINNSVYDKKWNEAVQLGVELDAAKRAIEKKYKPAGEWDRFEFDFDNSQVVFVKNENS